MRRSAWIFLAAILLPSLALAWLAVRSARDQQVILEHQQAIICQDITDALAKKVQDQVDSARAGFVQTTDQFLQNGYSPRSLATGFNQRLQPAWKLADVGFAVDLKGVIYSPSMLDGATARTFRNENDRFLTNRENVEVFAQNVAPPKVAPKLLQAEQAETAQQATPQQSAQSDNQLKQAPQQTGPQVNQNSSGNMAPAGQSMNQRQRANTSDTVNPNESSNTVTRFPLENQAAQAQRANRSQSAAANQGTLTNNTSQGQAANQTAQQQVAENDSQMGQASSPNAPPSKKAKSASPQMYRQVEPQSPFAQNALSNTVPEESDFRKVIGSETSGALARFLEDKLRVMVWYRPNAGSMVFGAQIMQQGLIENLRPLLQSPELKKSSDVSTTYRLVILDDRGKPVAFSRSDFTADWKHPFAATEIGEALPHWEAALYLVDPKQINRSASTLQLTLGLIVAVLVAAILLGGWLMAADVRRKMQLAQQKTDFVSNVSHELKTPLTSIRMFADMLAEGRVDERERQNNYLRIISAESARLTRLINNVLDFARMERGAPSGERRPCDLVDVVREVVDTCRPHLESVGVNLAIEIVTEEMPLIADRDALAQIILNLISNAEKYGRGEVLVRVHREESATGPFGLVEVLDRGPGIPSKKRETIFEPFQRLNDSLASGVSGSGLGLTLARRMARAHGGDVTYSPRDGGGSCFTLRLPLRVVKKEDNASAQTTKRGNQAI